jgi:hypothetical protein
MRVARIAGGQHGVITHAQLLAAGLSRDAVKRWADKGLLHRQHVGVYRVGHRAPSLEAAYLAAVLACGEGRAFLAGRAAAHVYGIVKRAAPPAEVVSLGDRSVRGVRTHRLRTLDPLDTSEYRGIPVTTLPRTLVDLAARLPLGALSEAAHHAEVLHRLRPGAVAAVVDRRGWTPGIGKLRAIFEGDAPILLSRLEKDFVALLKGAQLPLPRTNRPAGPHYVDCRWPRHHVTVELDSYRFHHTRHSWEHERHRARAAHARGDHFRRYTWGDVHETPAAVLGELQRLLLNRS